MLLRSLATLGFCYLKNVCASAPTANTAYGPVVGMNIGGVDVFYGIPFAAPPEGDLRWKAPVAPTAWTSPKQAVKPYVCPQESITLQPIGSEV
jgi:para-nitrobenzyl esterase